ncbi:hypothetical protein [Dyadobacter sp. CY312]|uniref:hypothetical protein n=1 Tax=Dyadobacter sp. CY312 TaxID=2907303 RepID=UPI001F16C963|nr:hypothetical protein [Dyadobacter sp. CY312]MCE7039677.1 hypothetical protein [Dyadobacter sp. CY312]
MKNKAIKFFTPQENSPETSKAKSKSKSAPTGYISATGKLVFPTATLQELGIEGESVHFQIGSQEGKRKLKSLYLVPANDQDGTFALEKSGRGYVIPLALILKKGGVDFENTKYTFSVELFNYSEGVVGYELTLISSAPKPEYTGKPRGRKKAQVTE